MPLPTDRLDSDLYELLSDTDTDNAKIIIRLAVMAAKKAARHGVAESFADTELGLKCAEIAERLGRTALYVATVERIDDSSQSDDPDGPDGSNGPDDPIDPDTPYDYDENIKPNGKAVDGIGYSEP